MENAKNHLLNHHKQNSYGLTGTKASCTRPVLVWSRAWMYGISSSVVILWDSWMYKQAVRSLIHVSFLLSFCCFFLCFSAVIDFVLSFIFYFDIFFKWMNVNLPTKREVSNWRLLISAGRKKKFFFFPSRVTFHISTTPGQVSFQE